MYRDPTHHVVHLVFTSDRTWSPSEIETALRQHTMNLGGCVVKVTVDVEHRRCSDQVICQHCESLLPLHAAPNFCGVCGKPLSSRGENLAGIERARFVAKLGETRPLGGIYAPGTK